MEIKPAKLSVLQREPLRPGKAKTLCALKSLLSSLREALLFVKLSREVPLL